MGLNIQYVRVSTEEQNEQRQMDIKITIDKFFIDKVSGKSKDRPELTKLLSYIREGDTLIVYSMDRLARNLEDLKLLVKELTSKGIKVQFVKENLIFSGDDNPISMLMLNIMGAFAEFERSLILERQKEGIAIAKEKGKYKGRRPALNSLQIEKLKNRLIDSKNKTALANEFGISRDTLYKYMKEIDDGNKKI
ncbi:MAG: recombinase family protein [Arcobacteraceae bacterium]